MKTPDSRTRTIAIIVVVALAFCLLCCVSGLLGQYLLENSGFSLV
jgi:hypothetical protein